MGGVLAGNCLDRISGAAHAASACRKIQNCNLSPSCFHQSIGVKIEGIFGFVFRKVREVGLKIPFRQEYISFVVSSGDYINVLKLLSLNLA